VYNKKVIRITRIMVRLLEVYTFIVEFFSTIVKSIIGRYEESSCNRATVWISFFVKQLKSHIVFIDI